MAKWPLPGIVHGFVGPVVELPIDLIPVLYPYPSIPFGQTGIPIWKLIIKIEGTTITRLWTVSADPREADVVMVNPRLLDPKPYFMGV
jgi:hypothetical protein